MMPEYVPGDRPAGFMATVSTPGADESVSHDTLGDADHVNVPPPELETVIFCDAGVAAPTVYEN
jgi:hypothetical protein